MGGTCRLYNLLSEEALATHTGLAGGTSASELPLRGSENPGPILIESVVSVHLHTRCKVTGFVTDPRNGCSEPGEGQSSAACQE